MDNVDGKQARRTGQSSGLGELFEYVSNFLLRGFYPKSRFSHGIDSLNCTLASLCETAAMGLGPSPKGVFTALIPCLPMFFSTWETYHTHTLYLGYFNGPTGDTVPSIIRLSLNSSRGFDNRMSNDDRVWLLWAPSLDSAYHGPGKPTGTFWFGVCCRRLDSFHLRYLLAGTSSGLCLERGQSPAGE